MRTLYKYIYRSSTFAIAFATCSGMAFAQCPTTMPVFDPSHPEMLPKKEALEMCIAGSPGVVACDSFPLVSTSSVNAEIRASLLSDMTSENARTNLTQFIKGGKAKRTTAVVLGLDLSQANEDDFGASISREQTTVVAGELAVGINTIYQSTKNNKVKSCAGVSAASISTGKEIDDVNKNYVAGSFRSNIERKNNQTNNSSVEDEEWVAPFKKRID